MRTTVTLEPDVERLIKKRMKARGIGFKEALNDAVRAAFDESAEPVDFPTYDMGKPKVDLTKALQLAGELEDARQIEIMRRGS